MVRFTEYLDIWQPLNVSSVIMDSSISNFEVVQVSRDISNGFSTARDFCLSGKKELFIALQKIQACEPEKSRTASPHTSYIDKLILLIFKDYPSVSEFERRDLK